MYTFTTSHPSHSPERPVGAPHRPWAAPGGPGQLLSGPRAAPGGLGQPPSGLGGPWRWAAPGGGQPWAVGPGRPRAAPGWSRLAGQPWAVWPLLLQENIFTLYTNTIHNTRGKYSSTDPPRHSQQATLPLGPPLLRVITRFLHLLAVEARKDDHREALQLPTTLDMTIGQVTQIGDPMRYITVHEDDIPRAVGKGW